MPWLCQGPRVWRGSRASREGGSLVFSHLSALGSLERLALAACLSFRSAVTSVPWGAGAPVRRGAQCPGSPEQPSLPRGSAWATLPVYPTHRNPFRSWLTWEGGGVQAAPLMSPGGNQSKGKGVA